eukprot:1127346-Amphidinium_carterae.1
MDVLTSMYSIGKLFSSPPHSASCRAASDTNFYSVDIDSVYVYLRGKLQVTRCNRSSARDTRVNVQQGFSGSWLALISPPTLHVSC